jgi:hypothetical protein
LSKKRIEMTLPMPAERAHAAVREALGAIGWRIQKADDARFACRDASPMWRGSYLIELEPAGEQTMLRGRGSTSGFGAGGTHVQGQLGALRNQLELIAARAAAPGEFIDELERLSRLHRDGSLTDEEFERAKGKLLD